MFHVTSPSPFKFKLGQRLAVTCSGENGECIARNECLTAEPQYLLRYRAADGRATEDWWQQSALEACDGVLTAATPGSIASTAHSHIGFDELPRIGAWWDIHSGYFAGIARGAEGAPDHHLILCADKPATLDLAWQPALDWAASLSCGGHTDWSLPTRAESALLFANLRGMFDPRWHWTSEQYSRDNAWLQLFVDGGQDGYGGKSYEGRARAVRRLVIQPFSHS